MEKFILNLVHKHKKHEYGRTLFYFTLLVSFFLQSCYASRQVWHHGKLLSRRQKISEIIERNEVNTETQKKLFKAREIVEFARNRGLNVENSYEYYIDTGSPVVSYLVQAAEFDQLRFKTWWFPIIGSVPYLGFYEKADRDELAKELESEGYDVKRGAAGAFSSLGWFQDPLFSSMLERSDTSLANLLFHELTHRTLWIPSSVEFNENFAEFVGGVLTQEFLRAQNRLDLLDRFAKTQRDRKKFRTWLISLRQELSALYAQKMSRKTLAQLKKALFEEYVTGNKKPKFELLDYVSNREQPWNNASLLSAILYTPETEKFERSFHCYLGKPSAVSHYIRDLRTRLEHEESPDKILIQLCS